jgi:DNA-binding transcriptional regulator LsrR (DeoR family)
MSAPASEPGAERDALKRTAAEAAVELVQEGMVVGLGTGSTAAFAIEALARRHRQGLRFVGIPTSGKVGEGDPSLPRRGLENLAQRAASVAGHGRASGVPLNSGASFNPAT